VALVPLLDAHGTTRQAAPMSEVVPCGCDAFALWYEEYEEYGDRWCRCAHGPDDHHDGTGRCVGELTRTGPEDAPDEDGRPPFIPAALTLRTGDTIDCTAFRTGGVTDSGFVVYEICYPSGDPVDVRLRDVSSVTVAMIPPMSCVVVPLDET
jgi:hypothetical protein